MTPDAVILKARRNYNAASDSFLVDAQLFDHVYAAQMELAVEALIIEDVQTDTSVASQRAYSFPTRCLAIKRLEYAGKKLTAVDLRYNDEPPILSTLTTLTGTPTQYAQWENTVYLDPIPSASSDTITFYTYKYPNTVSSGSTLDVGAEWHNALVYYVTAEIAAQDMNFPVAQYYRGLWDREVLRAKRWRAKKFRTDGPSNMKIEVY